MRQPVRNILATVAVCGLVTVAALAQVFTSAPPPASQSVTVNGIAPDGSGNITLAIPQPASTTPGMETVGGAPGASMLYRRADAVQPRITRAVSCTTASNGQCAVTWTDIGSANPKLVITEYVASTSATQAPVCAPVSGTVTATGATIKCWTTQSVTVSLLGAVVAPLTTAGAGVVVDIIAVPGAS